MFDDLRKSALDSSKEEESTPPEDAVFTGQQVEYDYDHSQDEEDDSEGRFLGLTAPQRFIIALFLLLIVCVVGAACLVLTGSVSLPFL